MPKPTTPNPDYFLNNLAMDEMVNPYSINAFQALHRIFGSCPRNDMKEMFSNFCASAISETYEWKEGSPGNLFYFSKKLEHLLEASFLVQWKFKKKKQPSSKFKMKHPDKAWLPLNLSEEEWKNPFAVLEEFYQFHSLPQWKNLLQSWTEAGLSNFSVTETEDPRAILEFFSRILKLIDAAWLIWMRNSKKKNKAA